MDVTEQEEAEGVRFVWNVWPGSRVDAGKLVVPLAVAVRPLAAACPRPVCAEGSRACPRCDPTVR